MDLIYIIQSYLYILFIILFILFYFIFLFFPIQNNKMKTISQILETQSQDKENEKTVSKPNG